MSKYRIIKDEYGYYPQVVRVISLVFWTKKIWLRIGRHNGGSFGLYDTLKYLKSYEECLAIIDEYKNWLPQEKRETEVIIKID